MRKFNFFYKTRCDKEFYNSFAVYLKHTQNPSIGRYCSRNSEIGLKF